MKQIDAIVNTCIEKGYVTPEKAPWLCYALEKRITSAISFCLLFIIGALVTNFATLVSFFLTFYFLRRLTNGWHAKTFGVCLICSVLGEVVFLGILSKLWRPIISAISLSISTIAIWFLAPYNHPNMNLTENEIVECKRQIRIRLVLFLTGAFVLLHFKATCWFVGIALGILMTASTLLVAYVHRSTKIS